MSDELDRDTRRGLRILAASTKTASDRTAKRLERAADSGSKSDYLEAEAMFNSLPPEERSEISSGAENRAKIVKAKIVEKQMSTTKVQSPGAGAMTWELGNIPGNPKMPAAGKKRMPQSAGKKPRRGNGPAAPGHVSWELNKIPPGTTHRPSTEDDFDEDAGNWDWQNLPDDPVLRSSRQPEDEPADEYELLRRQIFGKK